MGNQTSREKTTEQQLLSKWSLNEQEKLKQNKVPPSYFSKELFTCLTQHDTYTEYLETVHKILKLKDKHIVYLIFQSCIQKYNVSLKVFVSWIVESAVPLWFNSDVNINVYDSTRLVDFLIYHAKEQSKRQKDSMDWLREDDDKQETSKEDDWEEKATCSPSQIDSSEFVEWLNNTPSLYNLFCIVAEYAFFGSLDDANLHKRRLNHLASPHLESSFTELLSPFDYFMLTQYLPSHSLSNDTKEISHKVIFSSKLNGVSWQVFVNSIVGKGSTLVVIKSKDGALFGGYVDEIWEHQKTNWYGNSNNFLFQLNPKGGVWLGQSTNDHYQYLCWGKKSLPNGFGMGGQFDYCGLWIDSDFLNGHSRAGPLCSTFKSPQLTENDTFLIDHVEVWLMRPTDKDPRLVEGKGALNHSEDMEFMEMAGKKMYSKDLAPPPEKDNGQ